MKAISISIVFLSLLFSSSYAATEDNSIIEELSKETTKQLNYDYSLKTFQSCEAMEDVIEGYIKTYWENNQHNRFPVYSLGRGIADDVFLESEENISADESVSTAKSSTSADTGGGGKDFSETNSQVKGVDESDIVKTDGEYIYYYNQTNAAIYIIETASQEVLKKINLPKSFWGSVMYVDNNRLVVIASGYSDTDYSSRWYYINRNSKTYTIVFDTVDKSNPKLIKLHSSDGNVTDSRKIGDNLYVLSNNYFNFPYWNFKNAEDIDIDIESIIPKSLDISKTESEDEQNLVLKWKNLPYNIKSGSIADCNSIEYSFPDEETLKETNFNPWYNIISVINIADTQEQVTTKVIAGSNSTVYMSLDNLYLTEGIYQPNNFSCPPNAICAIPFFWGGTQNTLIHKLSVDGANVSYKETGLVPWAPLNQYSMDEHNWNFRIITSQWSPERSTGVYILDENLESISSLTNLAPGETFQSSRFMGDKLFLVTFEQIDPFFAIDLSDEENPEVLGELKIPGFSTYLHPYDNTHIIGLGYDTEINQWWGTSREWIKIDLYKINYDKKCGDSGLTAVQEEKCESWDYKWIIVEQLYTESFGGQWSYSEVLNNPRAFVWDASRNTLLLPATLYERGEDYRNTDFYNGLFSINIDKDQGIEVESKITHIDTTWLEEERIQECSKYSDQEEEELECKELLDGTLYCPSSKNTRSYVPNYCFADSPISEYLANKSWNYSKSFIKRALYVGDDVYAISDDKITTHDFNSLKKTAEVNMK